VSGVTECIVMFSQMAQGKKIGESVLFFGCRHKTKDYLYGGQYDVESQFFSICFFFFVENYVLYKHRLFPCKFQRMHDVNVRMILILPYTYRSLGRGTGKGSVDTLGCGLLKRSKAEGLHPKQDRGAAGSYVRVAHRKEGLLFLLRPCRTSTHRHQKCN